MNEIEVYGTVSTVEVRDELPIHRAALGNVPGFRPGDDPYFGVRDGFLASAKTKNTRIAYSQDLAAWKSWCDHLGVHPFAARRHDVDLWSRYMAEHPQPHTGRPASPATINRKLSAIANFYKYGIEDVELLTYSPVTNVERETVGEDSPTSGLSAVQLDHFLTAAENESPMAAALMSLLIYNGLRIGEALPYTIRDFRHDAGHRVLFIVRKAARPPKCRSPPSSCVRSNWR